MSFGLKAEETESSIAIGYFRDRHPKIAGLVAEIRKSMHINHPKLNEIIQSAEGDDGHKKWLYRELNGLIEMLACTAMMPLDESAADKDVFVPPQYLSLFKASTNVETALDRFLKEELHIDENQRGLIIRAISDYIDAAVAREAGIVKPRSR